MVKIIVSVFAAVVLAFTPTGAFAVQLPNAYPTPRVINPLPVKAIQIQGPRSIWGMRIFAKEVREQINVKVDPYGYCSDRPTWVCVRVRVGDYGSQWCGLVTYPRYKRINVYLNLWCHRQYSWRDRHTAAHEFGHALGLSHHELYGVCGEQGSATHLSRAELYVLRKQYGYSG